MNRYSLWLSAVAALVVGCAKADQSASKGPDSAKVAVTDTSRAATNATNTPDVSVLDSVKPATGVTVPIPPNPAAKGPPPSGPSTNVGVYTNEQAGRGKNVYAASCRSCHSPTSHTGDVFAGWWQNKRLSELYNFIANQMPKNDPGTLAPEDVADVVAYLLKMNEMPTGPAELYPDADSLKKFWIDTRKAK